MGCTSLAPSPTNIPTRSASCSHPDRAPRGRPGATSFDATGLSGASARGGPAAAAIDPGCLPGSLRLARPTVRDPGLAGPVAGCPEPSARAAVLLTASRLRADALASLGGPSRSQTAPGWRGIQLWTSLAVARGRTAPTLSLRTATRRPGGRS